MNSESGDGQNLMALKRLDVSKRPNTTLRISTHQKRVAIVIVNWNGWRDTIDCLDTLLTQDHSNCAIIIVDNDSSDGSVEKIIEWCEHPYRQEGSRDLAGIRRISANSKPQAIPHQICRTDDSPDDGKDHKVLIVQSGSNLGFAGGCNVGVNFVANGDFDYIWLLNSDTVVHQLSLSALISSALQLPSEGMTGSTLLYYRRPTVVQAYGGADLSLRNCVIRHRGEGMSNETALAANFTGPALTYVVGASMLVPTSLINTIGDMQDDYFLYYEEIDWSFRARGRYLQSFAPLSLIYHKAGASSKDKVSEFSRRLLFKNKIIFFSRYIPHLLGRLRLEMFKELCRYFVKGRWRLGKVLFGVLSSEAVVSSEAILHERPPSN